MRRAVSPFSIPLRVMGVATALVLLAACAPLGTPTPTPALTDTPIPPTPEWMV